MVVMKNMHDCINNLRELHNFLHTVPGEVGITFEDPNFQNGICLSFIMTCDNQKYSVACPLVSPSLYECISLYEDGKMDHDSLFQFDTELEFYDYIAK